MSSAHEVSETSPGQWKSVPMDSEAIKPVTCEEILEENPWGYGKRLRFIGTEIKRAFPLRQPGSTRVLDVGCGNGSLVAIPLARRGFDVTGTDLHEPSIQNAKKLAGAVPNARFIVGSVSALELPAFDVAILSEVLEHVPDPKGLLLATLRCLKPDGIVVVTVPNGYGEFEIDSWIFRALRLRFVFDFVKRFLRPPLPSEIAKVATAATDNHDCGHVQFFTRSRLKRMFVECSLEVAEESAGSFVCGPIIYHVIARWRRLIEWNVRVADRLPLALVSSWYFVLRRANR